MKKLLSKSLLALAAGLLLAGCVDPQQSSGPQEVAYEGISLDDYKTYILYDLQNVLTSIGVDQLDAAVKTAVETQYQAGRTAISAAESVTAAQEAYAAAKQAMAEEIPTANGVLSYISKSNAEKTEILGVLEAYAVRNGITGISLFENGGYVMYSDRVTLGTETYIPGYGFGVLAEGSITADLATEENAAWKRYYHTWNANDPGTANYLDDKGSEVSDFYSYLAGSYFTTFMNDEKNGYDWVPELASEKPVAVNPDANGMATKWRFEVKVGSQAKYTSNSQIASRQAFNNREVVAEDYITPFKLLLTQANGYERGAEMASTKTGRLKGAAEYYAASEKGAADFSGVGVKTYEEGGKTYFEYEFVDKQTPFYSMYYITSSLYQPIPQDFIDLVTPANYLGFNADKTETPVDNSLALGSYALEKWNSGEEVVYKKNPNYVHAATKYSIPGVHINILTAANEDQEAGFKEFMAGNTDSTGLPQTKLEQYKSDARTRKTTGDSNFKLNVNATDAETWEYFFGENGVVTQTPKEEYWEVEPALANEHFVKALSLAIDRITFADARGSIASVDYLSSNYMSDPENGISYSTTDAHKKAVAQLLAQTDGCGYNLELAREYFKVALAELEAEGVYQPGTAENPTVIDLEIAWMYPTHEDAYHKEIKQFLETAFNDAAVANNGGYKLSVNFWVGNEWSDVYYNKLMVGQYDLGFGSISGNSLNPLDFVSVLSSDQSISGYFTLNWGTDTNDVDADILVYDGMRWSYDALWTAANSTAVVIDGENANTVAFETVSHEAQADGTYKTVLTLTNLYPELVEVSVDDLVVCWYSGAAYDEQSILEASTVTTEGAVTTFEFISSAELVAAYAGDIGFDVYYTVASGELSASSYASVYEAYPAAE